MTIIDVIFSMIMGKKMVPFYENSQRIFNWYESILQFWLMTLP